jgi:hypothetical protein
MRPTILRCCGNIFTELLPRNDKGLQGQTHRYTRPTILLLLCVFVATGTSLPQRKNSIIQYIKCKHWPMWRRISIANSKRTKPDDSRKDKTSNKHLTCNTVKPLFIIFVRGLKKKRRIQENNRCGSHSLNRIHSGTTEIERRIRENDLSGNDR